MAGKVAAAKSWAAGEGLALEVEMTSDPSCLGSDLSLATPFSFAPEAFVLPQLTSPILPPPPISLVLPNRLSNASMSKRCLKSLAYSRALDEGRRRW